MIANNSQPTHRMGRLPRSWYLVPLLTMICAVALPLALQASEETAASAERGDPSDAHVVITSGWPYLGFRARLSKGSEASSLEVVDVYPEGPARAAKLQVGDHVVQIDGQPMAFSNDLERVLWFGREYSAGDMLTLEILRQDTRHEVSMRAGVMPAHVRASLERWIHIARQRLAEGESLYCGDSDPCQSKGDEGGTIVSSTFRELLHSIDGDEVLTLKRVESGWSFATKEANVLPHQLSVADLPQSLRSRALALRTGETLRIAITSDPKTRRYDLRIITD